MEVGDAEYLQAFSELPDDVKARILKPTRYKDTLHIVWINPRCKATMEAWRTAKYGAKTRAGGTCQRRPLWNKPRCRNHGGKSTGPRTPEGKARIAESNRGRAQARKAERDARGCGELAQPARVQPLEAADVERMSAADDAAGGARQSL